MIDISELEVFFININNYLENPLAKECLEENLKRLKGAKINILSEKNEEVEYLREILLNNRANTSFREKFLCYFCDYIKLYYLLNTDSKYCLYIDLDNIINVDSIKFILENPNSYYLDYLGYSSIIYSSNENKDKFFEVFNYMMNLGYTGYCELSGDKIFDKFFTKKDRVLIYDKNYSISWKKILQENKAIYINSRIKQELGVIEENDKNR